MEDIYADKIFIRNASPSDAGIIRGMAYQTWPSAYGEILSQKQLDYMLQEMYSLKELEKQMKDGNHFILAENHSATAMGFASFAPHKDDPATFHLHKIYVLPQFQKLHCGQALLEQVISLIKEKGGTYLQLNVNRYNRARHFYEKLGFKILREEDIDIGSGYFMNDFVMGKPL